MQVEFLGNTKFVWTSASMEGLKSLGKSVKDIREERKSLECQKKFPSVLKDAKTETQSCRLETAAKMKI